ncbi:MAG: methylglyoxal synthase [Candidatus Dormibacteria bacterium]|jgi:methylglyoxal synthase
MAGDAKTGGRKSDTGDTRAETTAAAAAEREPKRKPRLALIAHDGKKADMIAFATFNRGTLQRCRLVATSTTGRLLREKVGLNVEVLQSGPVGGDVQIASRVVDGRIDAVIFLVDPLDKHPHDPDIQTLLRICNVHDVPLATNIATADMVISSKLLWVAPEITPGIEVHPG